MSHAASEIISEIGAHIRKRGGAGHQWYVGIAADARDRLFSDHQVQKEGGVWITAQRIRIGTPVRQRIISSSSLARVAGQVVEVLLLVQSTRTRSRPTQNSEGNTL